MGRDVSRLAGAHLLQNALKKRGHIVPPSRLRP